MTTLEQSQVTALEPVRHALLEAARREADELRSSTSMEAATTIGAARANANESLARARAAGVEDAAEEIRGNAVAAQRDRRGALMDVRSRLYAEARARACDAVRGLLEDPVMRAALSASLEAAVGGTATVTPHPDGGLVGESPDGRRVVASVDALVHSALEVVDLQRLWSAT